MRRMAGRRARRRVLVHVIAAVVVSLTAFCTAPAAAEDLAGDRLDSLLLTPPGWAALLLEPLGVGLKGAFGGWFTAYLAANPLSSIGHHLEKNVTRPMLGRAGEALKESLPLAGLAAEDSSRSVFFYQDLARSVNIPPRQ